jgi:hypothetical protein
LVFHTVAASLSISLERCSQAKRSGLVADDVIRYSKFFGLDDNTEQQAEQQASANKRASRSAASQRTGLTQKDNLMWAAVRGITYVVLTFSDTSDPRDSNAVVKFGRVLETVAGAIPLSLRASERLRSKQANHVIEFPQPCCVEART